MISTSTATCGLPPLEAKGATKCHHFSFVHHNSLGSQAILVPHLPGICVLARLASKGYPGPSENGDPLCLQVTLLVRLLVLLRGPNVLLLESPVARANGELVGMGDVGTGRPVAAGCRFVARKRGGLAKEWFQVPA
jgi:hypothetical protein